MKEANISQISLEEIAQVANDQFPGEKPFGEDLTINSWSRFLSGFLNEVRPHNEQRFLNSHVAALNFIGSEALAEQISKADTHNISLEQAYLVICAMKRALAEV